MGKGKEGNLADWGLVEGGDCGLDLRRHLGEGLEVVVNGEEERRGGGDEICDTRDFREIGEFPGCSKIRLALCRFTCARAILVLPNPFDPGHADCC